MSDKKYKFEVFAGDFNSPFIRNYIFTKAFFKYPTLLGIPQLNAFVVGDTEKIMYTRDLSRWKECHEALRAKILEDDHFFEELMDKTIELGYEANEWVEENILSIDIKQLEPKKIIELYNEFIDRQGTLYALGVTLPVLDFQEFSFIEGNLTKFLQSKVSDDEYREYFRVFTEPAKNSFAQDQEEDLLRLVMRWYNKEGWRNDISEKSMTELEELHPVFFQELKEHTKKYNWVYYVYTGPAYTEQNFLEFIKDYLKKSIDPDARLRELEEKKKSVLELKKKYIEKLKPDAFNKNILELAGKMVWAKPTRKDLQSKFYHSVERLQREIGRRLHLSLAQVRSIPPDMLEQGLKTGEIDLDKINSIQKFHVCLPNKDGTVSVLHGDKAKDYVDNNIKKLEEAGGDVREMSGACAYAGNAKGVVKIVNTPQDMKKMNYGDVLVSLATTPSIVPSMKKAVAIVTDEGGLTCHASIVSRELGIPCVVGTKYATKVLKDGDVVEVDAEKGVVKKV